MSTKLYQSLSMAAVVALLPFSMAFTPVAAQDQTTATPAATTEAVQAQPGSGMGDAAGPLSGSVSIAAKTSQWYKFKYSFDENADKEATNAIVQLKMANPGLSFEVWTLGRLNAPLPDADDDNSSHLTRTPVGTGTPVTKFVDDDDDTNNNPTQVEDATRLSWVGSAEATETYFIVVKNKKDTANSYNLSISGPDVSY